MSTHLFVRSCFSLLDSTIRIPDLPRRARELGFDAVALTDHNVLHGAAAFAHACQREGIRPIFGLEADCLFHEKKTPFLLLAKNNSGYRSLMKLSSRLESMPEEVCSEDELISACDNCFLIAYGEGGWFDSELINEDRDGILSKLKAMKEELPAFDVAVSYQDASLWRIKNALLKRCCMSLGIRTVALCKVYYLKEEDAQSYRIACGIRQQKNLQDPTLPLISGRWLRSKEEMAAIYDAEDLERSDEIARDCRADLKLEKTSLPAFKAPAPLNSSQYLTQLCLAGLHKRFGSAPGAAYSRRLKYELSVIIKMHFEDYFLIVWDFIRYARTQNIYVGPGRGSAAGSLVAYCLGITQVDPLRYHLLFERFLNPERVSMPDIDTDFPDNRRDEVIRYVCETYGEDHAANIVTFGTLGARQVIRDVGKVLNLNARDVDMVCRMIPNAPKMTLDLALSQSPRLRQVVNAEEKLQKLFAEAKKLEGLPRHTSTHAAGIILSKAPLSDVIPTMRIDEGITTSQFTMEYLEERGLIKMDFLALRNLTIIDEIVRKIQESEPDFRIMEIPLDDKDTYALIRQCRTVGVFQLESEGMKNLLRKMQPDCFEDIVTALALFRPGPMDNINLYLANRSNPAAIRYPAPALKPVLESTYGIMIYQEQIMQTAQIAAGFSLARADMLRKAMAKKKEKDLIALRQEFLDGCRRNGYEDQTAGELYELVLRFAGYGFNRSHAVAYALIAYQLAYLKASHPLYFYCALLNSVIGDDDKSAEYISECRRRGIAVLYPDVNRSLAQYAQEKGGIRLPLSAVKGLGYNGARAVLEEREERPYDDFFDFVARAVNRRINRKMIENLISAGALDSFGYARRTMSASLDDAMNYADLVRIEHDGQVSINLSLVSKPVPVRMKDDPIETSENEKEALGFCLGPHPIIAIREKNHIQADPLVALRQKRGYIDGFGLIQQVHQHRTRKGELMAFVKLSDETGEMDLAVMPKLYGQKSPELIKGNYILFHGKMSDEESCLAEGFRLIGAAHQ